MLGYLEFYYHHDGVDVGFDPEFPADPLDFPRIRAKNAINHIALNLGGHGQTPTEWQFSTYPDWAQPQIDAAVGRRRPGRVQAGPAGAAQRTEDRRHDDPSRPTSW